MSTDKEQARRLANLMRPRAAYGKVGTRDVDQAVLQQVEQMLRRWPDGEPVAWYYVEDPWGANEWHFMTDSPESQNCDPRDWTPLYPAPPAARIAELEAALKVALEALWVCAEHNALHHGDQHNTTTQARTALQRIKEAQR